MYITFFLVAFAFCQEQVSAQWSKKGWGNYDESGSVRSVATELKPVQSFHSYSSNNHNIGIDLGHIFLMGDLARYSDSLGVRLHYTYGVSQLFALDTGLGYSEHSEGSLNLTNLSIGFRFYLPAYDRLMPYAILGLGFYRPSFKDVSVKSKIDNYVHAVIFGIHVGPGINLQLNERLYFAAGITFHNMFSTTKSFADGRSIRIGGLFSSFLINFGVSI